MFGQAHAVALSPAFFLLLKKRGVLNVRTYLFDFSRSWKCVLLKLRDLLQGVHLERLVAFLIGGVGQLDEVLLRVLFSPERRPAAGSC